MKAAVVHVPGGPEAYHLEQIPIPKPQAGWALVRIKAFGMNRSELFTRKGLSGAAVKFPRVLGIEAVGIVIEVTPDGPDAHFDNGDFVATCMGGMGRDFDGGYAEYTCVPTKQLQKLDKSLVEKLGWDVVGASPEMLQTAYGSLFSGLQLEEGQSLLIRGGTSSIGLAAAAIARHRFGDKVTIASTTRRSNRVQFLKEKGADNVFIDGGKIANDVKAAFPRGVDKVLELVGTTTLEDSLSCTAKFGIVCMTGMVGNKWTIDEFEPMDAIPHCVRLTKYDGGVIEFLETPINDLLRQVVEGKMSVPLGKTFTLDDIVEAAKTQEEDAAAGKIVVLP